jgi:nitroreductase
MRDRNPSPPPSMTDFAAPTQAFSTLALAHRSIRSFKPDPVSSTLVNEVLTEALHGSSSSGNLNMVSVVKTQDPARKARLHELHGRQPMVLQAPWVLTFCADTHRTRAWLDQRGARPGFADFKSFLVAAFDAVILAQTASLGFEARGLGICYMGTTLMAMGDIADFLELPDNVVPVTSLVLGVPDEAPAQRDRLPPTAWVHDERYTPPTPESIQRDFGEREVRGWARYRAMGEAMQALMAEHGITSLAQFYTSQIKYDPDRFAVFSAELRATLEGRHFMP